MNIFKKILFLLTNQEIQIAIMLLIMILIMALIDVIGVASIIPFVSVLSNPSLVETNLILNKLFQFSKFLELKTIRIFYFA